MKLRYLKLLTPVEGVGKIGTANWLTSDAVDMDLRSDGTVRITGPSGRALSNGWWELIVTPAAVAWYVPWDEDDDAPVPAPAKSKPKR